MIMRTFLERTNRLAGQTIHPFCTYAMSPGSVFEDYESFCPDSAVGKGLGIRVGDAQSSAGQAQTRLLASQRSELDHLAGRPVIVRSSHVSFACSDRSSPSR